jgi:hypothetical protein
MAMLGLVTADMGSGLVSCVLGDWPLPPCSSKATVKSRSEHAAACGFPLLLLPLLLRGMADL